jgi:hypothetical protein
MPGAAGKSQFYQQKTDRHERNGARTGGSRITVAADKTARSSHQCARRLL